MLPEILYTTALDNNGNVVHINNAVKGVSYYCPTCKKDLILKKSGKTGKGSKRPHFSHNETTSNCTPEGVLHYSFKKLLRQLLEGRLLENKAVNLNWVCNECSTDYTTIPIGKNLLENTVTIKEELNLKKCRPDLALLDKNNQVVAAIEIVVTHEPEENAIQYFKEKGITLIQLNLTSENDLDNIEQLISNPSIVNYCINPICKNLHNHEVKRNLRIGNVVCKNCRNKTLSYQLVSESAFGRINSPYLTENEIANLESHGVNFKLENDTKSGLKLTP